MIPAVGFPLMFDEFEEMAMHVKRVGVVGSIVKDQPVPGALLQHEFLFVRIRLAVHVEKVEFPCAARDFFEHHVNRLVRRGLRARAAENRVIPQKNFRGDPLRLVMLVRVFDHHAQPALRMSSAGSPKIQTPG